MIFLQLFVSFLYIGLFTIGGGYASLPLIQEQIVGVNGWLTQSEFADLITISQITPGPIAINAASFVGTKVAGFPGALCATLGFMLPPFIITSLFFYLYMRCREMPLMKGAMSTLRPAVVALIASAGLSILITALCGETAAVENINIISAVLTVFALAVLRLFKADQIFVILGCGLVFVAAEYIRSLV